jgi:hypothetical protein
MSRTECGLRSHSSEAEAPYGRDHPEHDGSVMAAAQKDRQPVVLGGDEPGERGHCDTDRNDARNDGRAGRPPYLRLVVPCLRQRIAEDQERKYAVPHHVEPDGSLRSRTEQPAGREQAGKGEGVDDGRHGREQISAREQQQRPRAGKRELRKQQDGGDQVVDRQGGLIARHERRDRGKRHAGKRHGAGEQYRRDADHGERGHAIAARGRHGRKKDAALVTHCRLRQAGNERATAEASNAQKQRIRRGAGHPAIP